VPVCPAFANEPKELPVPELAKEAKPPVAGFRARFDESCVAGVEKVGAVLEVELPAAPKLANPPNGLGPAVALPKPDCPNLGASALGPLIAGIDAEDPPNPNPAAGQ
jgi:hypothetical protein